MQSLTNGTSFIKEMKVFDMFFGRKKGNFKICFQYFCVYEILERTENIHKWNSGSSKNKISFTYASTRTSTCPITVLTFNILFIYFK